MLLHGPLCKAKWGKGGSVRTVSSGVQRCEGSVAAVLQRCESRDGIQVLGSAYYAAA